MDKKVIRAALLGFGITEAERRHDSEAWKSDRNQEDPGT